MTNSKLVSHHFTELQKKRLLSSFMLIFLAVFTVKAQFREKIPPAECQPNDDRIQVLLIASFHMSNPGADKFNMKSDDVLSPKRQSEIAQVVKNLSAFKPTKIAVEAPFNRQTARDNYRQYS